LVHITSFLKFGIFGALIANCLLPAGWPLWQNLILFTAIQLVFAALIGFVESFRARNRMNRNAQFL
jgi:hypothetical protein